MLVLSRKQNEEVLLAGGQIKVVVVEIRGDKVRLGFVAPEEVSIDRREVYESKLAEAEAMASELDQVELPQQPDSRFVCGLCGKSLRFDAVFYPISGHRLSCQDCYSKPQPPIEGFHCGNCGKLTPLDEHRPAICGDKTRVWCNACSIRGGLLT